MKKAKIAAGESASSSSAAAAAASSAASASTAQWTRPSAHDLAQTVRLHRALPNTKPSAPESGSKSGKRKSAPARPELTAAIKDAQHDLNRYLLLASTSAIVEINAGLLADPVAASCDPKLEVVYRGAPRIIEQLVGSMGAKVGFQDEQGFSAVHWMMFDALERAPGEAGISGAGDVRTVDLSGLARYAVEPILETLLRCSENAGFFNEWREDYEPPELAEDEEQKGEQETQSLMDLQDQNGNTPLHWAVHFRRVDLVGMLLLHGASVSIKNKAGQTPFDMVDWDAKAAGESAAAMDIDEGAKPKAASSAASAASSSAAAAASSSSASASAAASPSSIYARQGHVLERRWGLSEGLRIDQCRYDAESDSAAIKRLLFQARLFNAVEEGDSGDLAKVKALVAEWQSAAKTHRMHPLVYRSDVAWHNPLRVCVLYESGDTAILSELLRLPINLHVQPANPTPHAMHEAVAIAPSAAREMLLKAGCDINLRDLRTGATPLVYLLTLLQPKNDNPAKFNARLGATAEWLTTHGADPRCLTDQLNDAISFLVFRPVPLRLPILTHLISVVAAKDPKWIREHTNAYGSSLMHYALCQRFDTECEVAQLKALVDAGARVDGPVNHAGQRPLACFAGLKGKHHGAALALLKITPSAAELAVHGPPRPKLAAHALKTLVPDISGDEVPSKLHLKSEFADSTTDSVAPLLRDFKYTPIHVGSDALPGWKEYEYHLVQLFLLRNKGALDNYTTLRKRVDAQAEEPESSCVAPALVPLAKFEVRETAHKGLGLFAASLIPAAEKGIECCGELLTPSQAQQREREYATQGQIGFVVRPDKISNPASVTPSAAMIVDLRRTGNLSRFFNHSCSPNCAKYLISNDQRIVIYPIGEKEIRKDEELTINYFASADQGLWVEPAHTIVCQCGSSKCRRKLVAIPEDTPGLVDE